MAETGASPLPPTPSARSPLSRAEHFVWLTARVLEQRRFAYHFLGGTADAVETALAAYRNEDDGYGHALEPDLRGPVSQPLHAGHALRVLDSIGRCGGQRVERVCRYLTSVSTLDGALPAIRPSQRGYPTAPFVPVVDDPPSDLLATGPVVGLLHRNEVWHAWLFRATDFCWQAVESLRKSHPYEVEAAVAFLDSAPDRPARRRPPTVWAVWCASSGSPSWTRSAWTRPPYRPGTGRANITSRTTSRGLRALSRARGSRTRRWPARSTSWRPNSGRTAAGPFAGASGPPAPLWSAAPW
ncbi:hypothetical protein SAVCW2_56640 [Streptomyces avermitilis]|nr:hypothetical protein SAVCW2_56640 [Streptomyces avermitilis]